VELSDFGACGTRFDMPNRIIYGAVPQNFAREAVLQAACNASRLNP